MRFPAIALLAALCHGGTPAWAQTQAGVTQTDDSQIFAPEYFEQFSPQTAADMVDRLPGFEISGSSSGSRGFGQASLNILINGKRPSSKSQGANTILSQITADTVVRIEILDGASLDIPGLQGQVANIVVRAGELSGSWRYAARFRERSKPQLLEGGLTLTGQRGDLSFSAQLDLDQFILDEVGDEQFLRPDGTVFEDRTERTTLALQRPNVNVTLGWTPQTGALAGHAANLNLSASLFNETFSVAERFNAAAAPEGRNGVSQLESGEDEFEYEIGADYALPVGPGELKLIGLYRNEDSDFPTRFIFSEDDEAPLARTVFRDDVETESILRAEYNLAPAKDHTLQVSGEYALNTLESDSIFTFTGTDDTFDDVEVEENRFEGFITHGWKVSKAFNLQSSVGVEYSEIDVVSLDAEPRDFIRPKGTISGSYTISPEWTVRSSVERRVGQLGFGNFVSTVNLTDENATEGNDAIVPDQRWVFSAEVQRSADIGLSGTITAEVQWLEDLIENIRFDNGTPDNPDDDTFGPGNISGGTQYSLEAELTWVLDELVTPGLRLGLQGGIFESALDDPITGESRAFSGNTRWFYDVEFRYDLPNTPWAFEGEIEQSASHPAFRVNERFDNSFDRPDIELSVIHKDFLGMQWTVGVQNVADFKFQRDRQIFDTDRLGNLVRLETVTRRRGRRLVIELTDTF